jgi:chemotaxis protein CheD
MTKTGHDDIRPGGYGRYLLKPGFVYVSMSPTIIETVLGSCVAICLFDSCKKYGGMNHYLLPSGNVRDRLSTRYGDIAVRKLYDAFMEFGSNRSDIVARICGGGWLEESNTSKLVAEENVSVGKKMLDDLGVPLLSEDVGGIAGRRIFFSTDRNTLRVLMLKNAGTGAGSGL